MKASEYVYIVVEGRVGDFNIVKDSQLRPRIYFSETELKKEIGEIDEDEFVLRYTISSSPMQKQDILNDYIFSTKNDYIFSTKDDRSLAIPSSEIWRKFAKLLAKGLSKEN